MPDTSTADDSNSDPSKHDAYLALRIRDFRLLLSANFLSSFSGAILSVVVGWYIFELTRSALALGIVGLVQIIPVIFISLPAGQYVDTHDPKRIGVLATLLSALATLSLALVAATGAPTALLYVGMFVMGFARAFRNAVQAPLVAASVPHEAFGNASAWSSSSGQLAAVLGPAVGGVSVALISGSAPVFLVTALLLTLGALALGLMRVRYTARPKEKLTRASLLAGVHFVWHTKVIFSAILLDMVSVLLGGATALLPIFALEVLHVGATGLGLLRSAPAVGAVLMSFAVAHHGPFQRAGKTLLATVAAFGVATILLGLSRSFGLSLVALTLVGAFDAVSMVIRNTLQLVFTPDPMRGRVGAIHHIFIGMSNEFGEFESGLLAALVGATAAVIIGGVGVLVVVPLIALAWPELRTLGRIENPAQGETLPDTRPVAAEETLV